MSSPSQIAANIENAQSSSGPRTETGKATSSKNSVVFGLFSGDFVRPGEEHHYATLNIALMRELAPVGVLEEMLVEEIHRAMWRLRRCGEVESHLVLRLNDGENYILDPMDTLNSSAEKIQRSVDRARSQAHRLLHKCTAELRRHQSERRTTGAAPSPAEMPAETSAETPETKRTQMQPAGTPRNAPCPCGSGQKHKHCCGRNAPAVLQSVLKAA